VKTKDQIACEARRLGIAILYADQVDPDFLSVVRYRIERMIAMITLDEVQVVELYRLLDEVKDAEARHIESMRRVLPGYTPRGPDDPPFVRLYTSYRLDGYEPPSIDTIEQHDCLGEGALDLVGHHGGASGISAVYVCTVCGRELTQGRNGIVR
jgi:hypothetical protein